MSPEASESADESAHSQSVSYGWNGPCPCFIRGLIIGRIPPRLVDDNTAV